MSERVCAECGWGVNCQGTPPCRQNSSYSPGYAPTYPRCMFTNPNVVSREQYRNTKDTT